MVTYTQEAEKSDRAKHQNSLSFRSKDSKEGKDKYKFKNQYLMINIQKTEQPIVRDSSFKEPTMTPDEDDVDDLPPA